MKSFLLDENINSREFRTQCESEGVCHLRRFPSSLMGKKDSEVLLAVLPGHMPFVTSDFSLVTKHRSSICVPNSGVIIVRTNDTSQPFTQTRKEEIVGNFKRHYPNWFNQDWTNIYMEVYDYYVSIARLTSSPSEKGLFFGFGDYNFEDAVRKFIARLQGLVQLTT